MMSQSCRRDCGSRPVVGSSRNSSSGSPTRAQATASRCFWPPESLPTQASAFSSSDTRRDGLVGVEAAAVEAAEQRERLADGQLLGEARLLQRDADAFPDGGVVAAPAQAEDLDLAGGRGEQPFEDLDRRGLAGAVGAEQAEALARLDGQVEAAQRPRPAAGRVGLHEIRAADGGGHGGSIGTTSAVMGVQQAASAWLTYLEPLRALAPLLCPAGGSSPMSDDKPNEPGGRAGLSPACQAEVSEWLSLTRFGSVGHPEGDVASDGRSGLPFPGFVRLL